MGLAEMEEWIMAYDLGFLSPHHMKTTLSLPDYQRWLEVRRRVGFGTIRDNFHAGLVPLILTMMFGGQREAPPLEAFHVLNFLAAKTQQQKDEEMAAIDEVLNSGPIEIFDG